MRKTHVQYSLAIAAGIVLASLVTQPLLASTKIVGTCVSGNQFATIQAAVTASAAGDTVKVCPGNYPEQVVINKALTLVAAATTNADNPVITSPAGGVVANAVSLFDSAPIAAQILVHNATGVNIKQIAVDGSNNGLSSCTDLTGIFFQNASGSVANTATRNQMLGTGLTSCHAGRGIYIQSGYGSGGTATVSVASNSVHGYQKTGIIADGDGTVATISRNYVVGWGPTSANVQNGIQYSSGATGTASDNAVSNNVYTGPNSFGGSGILIYASTGVYVLYNDVVSTQLGVVTITDPSYGTNGNPGGLGDHTVIQSNHVSDTQTFDAIYVCSDNNTIQSNTLINSSESAIHLAAQCNSAVSGNLVTQNNINESCAGILESGTGNTISGNTSLNLSFLYHPGDTCSLATPALRGKLAIGAPVQQLHVVP
jgi:hypothetical protein